MNVYHIRIEWDDDWYVLQAEEDESIFSQSRTLDEAVLMIRDVLDLMKGEKDAELRLIVPANLPVDDSRQSGRYTDAISNEDENQVDRQLEQVAAHAPLGSPTRQAPLEAARREERQKR